MKYDYPEFKVFEAFADLHKLKHQREEERGRESLIIMHPRDLTSMRIRAIGMPGYVQLELRADGHMWRRYSGTVAEEILRIEQWRHAP